METQKYTRLEAAEAIFFHQAVEENGDIRAAALVDMVLWEAWYDLDYKKEYKQNEGRGWDHFIQLVQAHKAMDLLPRIPEKATCQGQTFLPKHVRICGVTF